jgi:DNA-directed RNA polymerase subunit K/omega
MDVIAAALLGKGIQGIARMAGLSKGAEVRTSADTETKTGEEFDKILKGLLSPDEKNMVNEEELFAALVFERLNTLHGRDLAADYQQKFEQNKEKLRRADGHTFVEDAAGQALRELVRQGKLNAEEADTLYAQAFRAAQLDDNHDQLYDSRGGADDPTVAMEEMEAAILSARMIIKELDTGEKEMPQKTLAERPNDSSRHQLGANTHSSALNHETPSMPSNDNIGSVQSGAKVSIHSPSDGPGGFLFKPISESDGKLVVLLPAMLTQKIEQVLLRDKAGNELERGRMAGVHNEGREHFRFSKAGPAYPSDLTVEVRMHDGSIRHYKISDPSKRWD